MRDGIAYTMFPTPVGALYVAATDRGVCRLTCDVSEQELEEDMFRRYGRPVRYQPSFPILRAAEDQLERYFMREIRRFDLALDFLEGTAFHQRVWRILQTIPYGQTRSYKWVAEQAGLPHGARAAGQANSRNRIGILVPCHRVINHNGQIGGYGDRPDIKAYLLDLEGASCAARHS
jgi:O-6-methylguanine DNA methyltransferase